MCATLSVRQFRYAQSHRKAVSLQTILFVTLSNIGDAVMTTPALEALHQTYPNAVIDLVCDARSVALFEHCPYRGQIFIKQKRAGWRGHWALMRQLRQTKYDLAVDLRTDVMLWLVRAKQKCFKLSNKASFGMQSAVKHFKAVQPYVNVAMPDAVLWASKEQVEKGTHVLGAYAGKRILGIGLGANFVGKIWPVVSFAQMLKTLESKKSHFDAVLLLGSASERAMSQSFIERCALPVIDVCGQLSLVESYAIMRHLTYFVGNDSGLGHMASAAKVPSFTIFGPGEPHRYLPWSKQARFYQDSNREITGVEPVHVAALIEQHLEALK